MDNDKPVVEELNDPLHNAIYNEALEWAACWIEGYLLPGEPISFETATALVESIRAAKNPTDFQQDFFDAIRNDPYMEPKDKAFWLSKQ